MRRSVGVSWIGKHDLDCFAATLSETRRNKLFKILQAEKFKNQGKGQGAIRTFLNDVSVEEIHLLSNYDINQSKAFVKWIGNKAKLHMIDLKRPTDYKEVYKAVDKLLQILTEKSRSDLLIHLSSGTPAMTAIWVLLGKSRYPARFFQTFKGKTAEEDIPFDLQFDYLPKALRNPDLNLQSLVARSPGEVQGFEKIIGNSKSLRIAVGMASKAAIRNVPILLLGESGTGKEVFAQAIHEASPRSKGPFVPLNCAAIPQALLESELFGHKSGAFTGAKADHPGAFEQANSGTLFLDEVGECNPDMQAKLLRVLQPPKGKGPCFRVFRRVGDTKDKTSDVRILAATNRNLLYAVRDNEFREDLYYRLAVIKIQLPSLRERRNDIPSLSQHFLNNINEQFIKDEPGFKTRSFSKDAIVYFKNHDWPGNIRELYNVILQAVVLSESSFLSKEDILTEGIDFQQTVKRDELSNTLGDGFDLIEHLESIQKHYLQRERSSGISRKIENMEKSACDIKGKKRAVFEDRGAKAFFVPKEEIVEQNMISPSIAMPKSNMKRSNTIRPKRFLKNSASSRKTSQQILMNWRQ